MGTQRTIEELAKLVRIMAIQRSLPLRAVAERAGISRQHLYSAIGSTRQRKVLLRAVAALESISGDPEQSSVDPD